MTGLDAVGSIAPNTIAFTITATIGEPESGLVPFTEWGKRSPAQRRCSPLPGLCRAGLRPDRQRRGKPRHEALKGLRRRGAVHRARSADRIDLKRFATIRSCRGWTGDQAQGPEPGRRHPTKDPAAAFAAGRTGRGARRPTNLHRVALRPRGQAAARGEARNKLEDGGKKIAEFVSFQSELRVLPPDEAAKLVQ